MVARSVDREIFGLALPALGTLAAEPIVSLVDTAFVGQIGGSALAALGVCAAVLGAASWIFVFLAYGTTPLIATARAEGREADAASVAIQGLWLAALLGLVNLVVLEVAAVPLLQLMGATDALLGDALVYLRIRAIGAPAVLLITAGNGIFRGVEDTRTPLAITIGLGLANLIGDAILILGLGWGLTGAAIASAVAQWGGAIGFVALALRPLDVANATKLPRLTEMLPLIRVGGALFARGLALVGTLTLATAVATRAGRDAVAAHQLASQLWLFLAYIVDALAVAGQVLVARNLGLRDIVAVRRVARRLLGWGGLVGVGLGLGLWLGQGVLPVLLTADVAVREALGGVFLFVVIAQPLNAIVFVLDGLFMGARRFGWLAGTTAAASVIGAGSLLLVGPLSLGLTGVWGALTLFMVARGVGLALGWRRALLSREDQPRRSA